MSYVHTVLYILRSRKIKTTCCCVEQLRHVSNQGRFSSEGHHRRETAPFPRPLARGTRLCARGDDHPSPRRWPRPAENSWKILERLGGRSRPAGMVDAWGGGRSGRGPSIVACVSFSTIGHGSPVRRSTVPTPAICRGSNNWLRPETVGQEQCPFFSRTVCSCCAPGTAVLGR